MKNMFSLDTLAYKNPHCRYIWGEVSTFVRGYFRDFSSILCSYVSSIKWVCPSHAILLHFTTY